MYSNKDIDWKEFAIGFWTGIIYASPVILVLVGAYLGVRYYGIF